MVIGKEKKQKNQKPDLEFTVGSGNVFADFGFKEPEKEKAKSNAAILIAKTIKDKGMTQQQAADILGIDQPKVSKITRGLLSEFSIETLTNLLISLGYDVSINATPHKKKDSKPTLNFVSNGSPQRKYLTAR